MKIKLNLEGLETSYGEVIGNIGKISFDCNVSKEQFEILNKLIDETSTFNIDIDVISKD